jgi:hypothetical protein
VKRDFVAFEVGPLLPRLLNARFADLGATALVASPADFGSP